MLTNAMTRRSSNVPFWASRDPFASLVEGFMRDLPSYYENGGAADRAWMPAVDIRETGESFIATAELPGMNKNDIQITIDNNILTLRGERRMEDDQKTDGYHRIERSYGTFQRSFTLPTGVDSSSVSASFKDGLLTLNIPKAEEAKPRTIKVS